MSETSKIREYVQKKIHELKIHCFQCEIIDIGCGDDPLFKYCTRVDRRKEIKSEYDDALCIPQADGCYPVVYSSYCLEDFEDIIPPLTEWIRILSPGGVLVLYMADPKVYPKAGTELANKAHKRDIYAGEVVGALVKLGMSKIEVKFRSPPDGKYDYENRGNIEYSFLIFARK